MSLPTVGVLTTGPITQVVAQAQTAELPDYGATSGSSEKDTKLAQKLGQLQPLVDVFPQASPCMGQLAYIGPT